MTRIAKLYAYVIESPNASISFRDFEKLLMAFGFSQARVTGSHRHFVNPRVPGILTVQPRGKDAKTYQVRQFLDMVVEFRLESDG